MKRITLDTNAIIDLESKGCVAQYANLLDLFAEGKIILRIPAISASERKPDGTYVSNFNEFKKRISAIGLSKVEILAPIACVGMCYVDYCVCSGGNLSALEARIQRILFPEVELEFTEYCKNRGLSQDDPMAWRKWVNAKCDVLSLWCHIYYKGDIFVTRDNDFHKKTKKPLLVSIGAGEILRPDEVLAKLS